MKNIKFIEEMSFKLRKKDGTSEMIRILLLKYLTYVYRP